MQRDKYTDIAAQLWCKPKHQHKEMDVDFAMDIAAALRQAVEDVIDQVDDWDPMMADCLRKEFLPTPDKLSTQRGEHG